MTHLDPIDLLKERLSIYQKANEKSFNEFVKGKIDLELRMIHVRNNKSMIRKYEKAIEILNQAI